MMADKQQAIFDALDAIESDVRDALDAGLDALVSAGAIKRDWASSKLRTMLCRRLASEMTEALVADPAFWGGEEVHWTYGRDARTQGEQRP